MTKKKIGVFFNLTASLDNYKCQFDFLEEKKEKMFLFLQKILLKPRSGALLSFASSTFSTS